MAASSRPRSKRALVVSLGLKQTHAPATWEPSEEQVTQTGTIEPPSRERLEHANVWRGCCEQTVDRLECREEGQHTAPSQPHGGCQPTAPEARSHFTRSLNQHDKRRASFKYVIGRNKDGSTRLTGSGIEWEIDLLHSKSGHLVRVGK